MRVKFCGITRVEDAREGARLGAWAIGLIHQPSSPRCVEPAVAAEIGAELKRRAEVVGVFVNASLGGIVTAAENESLTVIQLHGDEGPAFCQEVARRSGCRVIKAMPVRSAAEVRAAEAFRTDYHLFDAYSPAARGGTGDSFDWELLGARSSAVPAILAGGLRPDNVGEAISIAHPFAVDVSTGVEAAPGVKDHGLMASFMERAHTAPAPSAEARRSTEAMT